MHFKTYQIYIGIAAEAGKTRSTVNIKTSTGHTETKWTQMIYKREHDGITA